jgi:asparaginyl-tRNA synthetase
MEKTSTIAAIRDLGQRDGREATLRGWLVARRSGGKVCFLTVRDGTGLCQCVVEPSAAAAFTLAGELTPESSLTVTGVIRAEARAPGGYEMAVTRLHVLQRAVDYPITRKAHGIEFLMDHRHLWLRSARQTAILKIRHTIIRACREYFDRNGFTLVDTPILVSGAGEDRQSLFSVDYFGEPAQLTQTGQLHLETACMALGKVYCFGPTFRAEKSKTRRHLTEFWMIEPEIAFADVDEVMAVAESLICDVVARVVESHPAELALLGRDVAALREIRAPFPRLTYQEAMEVLRGPETRERLTREIETDRVRLSESIHQADELERQRAGETKAWKQEQLDQLIREARESIHELEQELAVKPQHLDLAQNFEWGKDLGGSDETILSRRQPQPMFVTDYPREVKAFYMKVHPLDARLVRNFDLLAPEGYGEIIGGSQREEDEATLRASLAAKGLNPEDYAWYLDLRKYGSVPHGGFGLGIERTVTWLCGLKHVRETIAYPRLMGRLRP